jgi:catechol 2,3-dioxygenase-like lactoylglutathione lyase family enzyme
MASSNRGISHIGLATLDPDGTRRFYEQVLGFDLVFDTSTGVTDEAGAVIGSLRHVAFDTGHEEWLTFISPPQGIPGIAHRFDTGINEALGVPRAFYHLAFEVSSQEHLEERRQNLVDHGVRVTPVHDFGTSRSCYFEDPVNGLQLEYAHAYRQVVGDEGEGAFDIPLSVLLAFPWMDDGTPTAEGEPDEELRTFAAAVRTSMTAGD